MKLNKRECSISIELVPCGADMLKIIMVIGEDRHIFWASSVMGYQFFSFVEAIYQLYSEVPDTHHIVNYGTIHKAVFSYPDDDPSLQEDEIRVKTSFSWDGEGMSYTTITLNRKCRHWNYPSDGKDLIELSITNSQEDPFVYIVDGHDLCYAVAKAYTETIKKHGIYGYYLSTGGNCNGIGDTIDLHMILFIKAYALDAMEVRELKTVWKGDQRWQKAVGTSLNKEIELLLFDM